MESLKKRVDRFQTLTDYHFKFIFLFNAFFFLFYTFYRIYMAAYLMVREGQNFFLGEFNIYEPARLNQRYTLFRVFIPLYLLLFFLAAYYLFFKKEAISKIMVKLKTYLIFEKRCFLRYGLFLLVCFFALSFIFGFTHMIKNSNTQYGFLDADSYVSLVALMYRQDFNAEYVPEGGLQFGKYYIITIPTLILTYILGIGRLVTAYNITITLLVFLTIVNTLFIFRNLFYFEKEKISDELAVLGFMEGILVTALSLVTFPSYFNYNAFLRAYCNGLYGAIGGFFLLSSSFLIIGYLVRKDKIDLTQMHLIFLMTALMGSLVVQSYFHITLFFLPIAGMFLVWILSHKAPLGESLAFFFLFTVFLGLLYGSFEALDIMPRYSIQPIKKLQIISGGLLSAFLLLFVLNRIAKDFLYKLFLKLRSVFFLSCILVPFLWYWPHASKLDKGKLFEINLWVGDLRTFLFGLFLQCLVVGYLSFFLLKTFFYKRLKRIFYLLVIGISIVSLVVAGKQKPTKFLPAQYPAGFPEERIIEDATNLYAFDKNGIRVSYNQYLVDVVQYFARNNITDMYYWLVSKTPSLGVYEHGLLQRLLVSQGHQLEGITVKHFTGDKRALIPDWAKFQVGEIIIEDYNDFSEHIIDIAKATEWREILHKRRFVIIDNNFPEAQLELLNKSPLFHKLYENKLYKVYRMGRRDSFFEIPLRINDE